MSPRSIRAARLLPAIALILTLGCSLEPSRSSAPPTSPVRAVQSRSAAISRAIQIQELYSEALLATTGVVGTATATLADGTPCVQVYTLTSRVLLPAALDGVSVVTEVTGPLERRVGQRL
jgi:hypothetical protein